MPLPLDPAARDDLERALRGYETLAKDLREVLASGVPTAAELPYAPLLDHWIYGTRTLPCLVGTVIGHPIRDATAATKTSPLLLINHEAAVARTESRWYRLGRRVAQDDLKEVADRIRID